MPDTDPVLPADLSNHSSYEAEHVHRVYEDIAPHFSATRFKPWPIVDKFLSLLPVGSVGLDVGCGNGKYLTVNPNVFLVGSDRSSNLVRIANDRNQQDALVADGLELPHPEGRFDFAISIAVIHHFSSGERRREGIRCILGCLRRDGEGGGGRALIYCWALEQGGSRRGWKEGDPQDVFVPWVMSRKYAGEGDAKSEKGKKRKRKGDTASPSQNNGNAAEEAKDAAGDTVSPAQNNGDAPEEEKEAAGDEKPVEVTYQRYYHLYKKGELEADISAAGGIVLEAGYEKDNWWAICKRSPSCPDGSYVTRPAGDGALSLISMSSTHDPEALRNESERAAQV